MKKRILIPGADLGSTTTQPRHRHPLAPTGAALQPLPLRGCCTCGPTVTNCRIPTAMRLRCPSVNCHHSHAAVNAVEPSYDHPSRGPQRRGCWERSRLWVVVAVPLDYPSVPQRRGILSRNSQRLWLGSTRRFCQKTDTLKNHFVFGPSKHSIADFSGHLAPAPLRGHSVHQAIRPATGPLAMDTGR